MPLDIQNQLMDRAIVEYKHDLNMRWNSNFELLKQYKDREGHCIAPHSHQEDGKHLGHWLSTQRKDKAKETLDIDKENCLTAIGIVWNPLTQQWEDMYSLLEQYKDREGHCNAPHNHQEDGKYLGHWLSTQRKDKAKETLDIDKENCLTANGIV